MDQSNALIFIPDISGFTKFVKNTEILHARHIISELLEIIIDANEIELKVSEVEGDAVLFYRFGESPSISDLLAQVQKMYTEFKAYLKIYESQRICQCGACTTAQRLSLKFVAHYGEVVLEHVKEHIKLFGSDVIVAHRLLKNDLPNQQYLLLTDPLLNNSGGIDIFQQKSWEAPVPGSGDYDFGIMTFYHLSLNKLDALVPEPTIVDFSLPEATMQIDEYEGIINAPLQLVFDVVSDLAFRDKWIDGLKGSDKLNGIITRNGSTHRCVINGNNSDPYFYTHDFEKENDLIRFTESDHKKGISNVYNLQAIGGEITRMTIYTFMKPNALKKWVYVKFFKPKFTKINIKNYQNLNSYCNELMSKHKVHESQIIL